MQFEGKVIRQLNEGMLRVGECAMARETQINSTISHSITIYNDDFSIRRRFLCLNSELCTCYIVTYEEK